MSYARAASVADSKQPKYLLPPLRWNAAAAGVRPPTLVRRHRKRNAGLNRVNAAARATAAAPGDARSAPLGRAWDRSCSQRAPHAAPSADSRTRAGAESAPEVHFGLEFPPPVVVRDATPPCRSHLDGVHNSGSLLLALHALLQGGGGRLALRAQRLRALRRSRRLHGRHFRAGWFLLAPAGLVECWSKTPLPASCEGVCRREEGERSSAASSFPTTPPLSLTSPRKQLRPWPQRSRSEAPPKKRDRGGDDEHGGARQRDAPVAL